MRVVFVLRSAEAYPVFPDLFFPFFSPSGGRSWFRLEPRPPPFFLVNFFFSWGRVIVFVFTRGLCLRRPVCGRVCANLGGVRGLYLASPRVRSCLWEPGRCAWFVSRIAARALVFSRNLDGGVVCVLHRRARARV